MTLPIIVWRVLEAGLLECQGLQNALAHVPAASPRAPPAARASSPPAAPRGPPPSARRPASAFARFAGGVDVSPSPFFVVSSLPGPSPRPSLAFSRSTFPTERLTRSTSPRATSTRRRTSLDRPSAVRAVPSGALSLPAFSYPRFSPHPSTNTGSAPPQRLDVEEPPSRLPTTVSFSTLEMSSAVALEQLRGHDADAARAFCRTSATRAPSSTPGGRRRRGLGKLPRWRLVALCT